MRKIHFIPATSSVSEFKTTPLRPAGGAADFVDSSIDITPPSLITRVCRITLHLVEFLVQLLGPPFDSPANQAGHEATEQNKSATEPVKWLLGRWKEVRAEPVARLRYAVGDSN